MLICINVSMRIKLIIGYNSDSLGPVLCSLIQFAADLFQVSAVNVCGKHKFNC